MSLIPRHQAQVITNLVSEGEPGLFYSARQEQQDLLSVVLKATADDARTEHLTDDKDDIRKLLGSQRPGVRRKAGSVAALTGADGAVYKEYSVVPKTLDKALARIDRLFTAKGKRR